IRNRKNAVELCKAIREDRLLKHNLGTKQEENIDRETYKKLTYKAAISPPLCVDEIVNYINSSEETLQLRAIQSYERLGEEKNSVNDMIKGGIISRCIELLDSNNISLQFEVTSLLNIITSDTSKKSENVIKYEVIPKLLNLLEHKSSIISELAMCVLCNVIDTPYARDIALSCNSLPILIDFIKPDTSITLMDNITWLLSNLYQKTATRTSKEMEHILPVLNRLLSIENDYIISDTCRILSYLTDGSKSNVQAIMETGILPKLLECLTSEKKGIFFPTLLTIRNIVEFGDDAYKDDVITAGGLPCLRSVLSLHCDKEDVTEKETIWIICKMAGNMDQIQSIIDAGLLKILINRIAYENKEIKMLSGLVLMNMLSSGTSQQLTELLNAGVLIEFCNLLKTEDYDIVINALKGFSKILHNAKEKGQIERFATMIEEAGGLNRLVALRCHQNEMIYKKSTSIIHLYYFLIN
ncbi:Importin subunit alpha-1, partial [Cyphomyrmex costatus]